MLLKASVQDRDGALNLFIRAKKKLQGYRSFLLIKDTKVNYKTAVYWKQDVYAKKVVDTGFQVNVGLLKELAF